MIRGQQPQKIYHPYRFFRRNCFLVRLIKNVSLKELHIVLFYLGLGFIKTAL